MESEFSGNARYRKKNDGIQPHTQEDSLLEVFDSYMSQWIDEPVPALEGLTPRQASKKSVYRRRLTVLLQELETHPPSGCESYDFSWVWEELGLKWDR